MRCEAKISPSILVFSAPLCTLLNTLITSSLGILDIVSFSVSKTRSIFSPGLEMETVFNVFDFDFLFVLLSSDVGFKVSTTLGDHNFTSLISIGGSSPLHI